MDPRDNIDFDFFEDEPATTEAQSSQSRVRLPRRGGRGTGGARRPIGPPRGLTPLLRLLAVIAILVAALVFFGLLIQSCASTSKHDAYKNYMGKVASVAQSSAADGAELASELTTQGVKVSDIEGKLAGLAEQERQTVNVAQRLDPPGPLRPEHENLIEALQLRVNGIEGLADAFRRTAGSKATTDAAILAAPAERLLASDVMWDDLFLAPSAAEMKRQGVTGVVAPESHFVTNQDLISERSMALVLQRLRGASTSGTPTGIHGTNVVSTKVLPGGQVLDPSAENTVTASTDLAFVVTVHNGGDSQEVGIKVTLTIQKPQGAIVKTKPIPLIDPSQDTSVTFTNLGQVPFAQKTKVNVDVAPVPGEHDATNNKASYPVIFSLG
jgi:CARDB protein